MKKNNLLTLAAGAAIMAGLGGMLPNAAATTVTTDGYQIKIDGKRFLFKGVNYAVVPIGMVPGPIAPHGDYFTKKYEKVWKWDLDKMREAGVNSIRLYAGDPITNAGQPGTAGKWKEFLDYCYNDGKKPIYVFMTSYIDPTALETGKGLGDLKYQWELLVKSTVTHPAVVGYVLGNEIYGQATNANAPFWKNYGTLLDNSVQAAKSQGKTTLFMAAINDDVRDGGTPNQYWPVIEAGEKSGHIANMKCWGLNLYRGAEMGGAGNNAMEQYQNQMQRLGIKKPMVIGEWGTPHSTRSADVYKECWAKLRAGVPIKDIVAPSFPVDLDTVTKQQMGKGQPYEGATSQGDFLKKQWAAIKAKSAAASSACSGGFLFMWCDEWYKADPNGSATSHKGGPNNTFFGGAFAGGFWDEGWFGLTGSLTKADYESANPPARAIHNGYNAMKQFYK